MDKRDDTGSTRTHWVIDQRVDTTSSLSSERILTIFSRHYKQKVTTPLKKIVSMKGSYKHLRYLESMFHLQRRAMLPPGTKLNVLLPLRRSSTRCWLHSSVRRRSRLHVCYGRRFSKFRIQVQPLSSWLNWRRPTLRFNPWTWTFTRTLWLLPRSKHGSASWATSLKVLPVCLCEMR